jgi:hypothetical protein
MSALQGTMEQLMLAMVVRERERELGIELWM